MSLAVIGGLLMIVGSFTMYKGFIFYSVFSYLIADLIWAILAFQSGDIFGGITIVLGTIFGILTFLKMHKGEFVKHLGIDNE